MLQIIRIIIWIGGRRIRNFNWLKSGHAQFTAEPLNPQSGHYWDHNIIFLHWKVFCYHVKMVVSKENVKPENDVNKFTEYGKNVITA